MKNVQMQELGGNGTPRFLELGYHAAQCSNPCEFGTFLDLLKRTFPLAEIVSGYGAVKIDEPSDQADGQVNPFPDFDILGVYNHGWPEEFLENYLASQCLDRDSHFYDVMMTGKPKLWSDFYAQNRHPFDPVSRTGSDKVILELFHDFDLTVSTTFAMLDSRFQGTNFSVKFNSRRDFRETAEIIQSVYPFVHEALIRSVNGSFVIQRSGVEEIRLSNRQREVLKWVSEGKTNWEIGVILGISERTIKFHVKNLMEKLEATNRYHLVARALQNRSELGLF